MSTNNSPEVLYKEGDIYKTVTAGGHTFTLRYGYYEDYERSAGEPVVVYPDLSAEPLYSADGYRVVTAVQDVCDYFNGKHNADDDCCCGDCAYYLNPQACIDVCTCEQNRKDIL